LITAARLVNGLGGSDLSFGGQRWKETDRHAFFQQLPHTLS
jgi:hypothetical protein